MKPVKLTMKAFGPFLKETTIDFEALGKNMLFLIQGNTGSGKSFILDALSYALFGMTESKRAVRCGFALPGDETMVELEFKAGDRVYKVSRRIRYTGKNGREIDPKEACELSAVNAEARNDLPNPLASVRDMNEKIKKLLKMDYQQFSRIISIPQGKFERFLLADTKEKEAILTGIFTEAGYFEAAAKKMQECREELGNAIERMKSEKDGYVKSSRVEIPEARKAEPEKVLEEEKQKLEDDIAGLAKVLTEVQKELEAKNEAKASADSLNKYYDDYDKASEKKKKLDDRKSDIEAEREQLKKAAAAREIKPLADTAEKAEKQLRDTKEAIQKAGHEKEAAERAVTSAEKAVKDLENNKSERDNAEEEKIRLEGKRENYEKNKNLEEAWNRAVEAEGEQKKKRDAAETAFTEAQEEGKKLKDDYDEKEKQAQEAADSYYGNIFGIEAKKLNDGDKCPVCGSVHHPEKAGLKEEKPATYSDMEKKRKAAEKAKKAVEDQAKETEKKNKNLDNEKNALADCKDAAIAAEAAYNENRKNLDRGIADLDALDKKIKLLSDSVKKYDDDKAAADKVLEAAKTKLTRCEAESESLDVQLPGLEKDKNDASDRLDSELTANSLTLREVTALAGLDTTAVDEEVKAWEAALSAIRGVTESLEKNINGRPRPDVKAAEEAAVTAQEKRDAVTAEKQARENGSKDLTDIIGHVKKLQAELDKAEKEYNSLSCFVNAIIGKTEKDEKGNTRLRLSLKNYYLSKSFEGVVSKANDYLRTLKGGRYQLMVSSEAKGNAKVGLDLCIIDDEMGKTREVGSLSGGEMFMVSLSLAKGLSEIVQTQAGGLRLDALFIDEGFGTLDNECLRDVLGMLEKIGRGRMVGVISHVEALGEVIHDKLTVDFKGKTQGSVISVN